MTRTLLGQNIVVLMATTLFALVLSLSLIAYFAIRPEAQRAANFTLSLAEVLAFSVDRMNPQDRVALLQLIDNQQHINVKVQTEPPENAGLPASLPGRFFLRELEAQNGGPGLENWRVDEEGRFWMRLPASEPPIWVSFQMLQARDPVSVFLGAFAVTLLTSVIGGVVLHRRVARPLEALARQVGTADFGTSLPVLDETGPREVVAVSRALNQMSETMRQVEKDRSVMLAGVSHDLRTPLTKLRLSLAMLRGADPELLSSADRQVERIETMLEQFLEYARGFSEEPVQNVDLEEVLHLAIEASAAGDAVRITCPAEITVPIKKNAIVRAISNLVTNAAHHGARPIEVSVRITGATLNIDVSDAGHGLTPEQADGLIRPFARGETARTSEGAGLGLAIAHQAAVAHDGELRVQRSGSRFTVCLSVTLPTSTAESLTEPGGTH